MSDPQTDGRGVRGFFGGLLMLVGFLMAGLCGLCTVVFIGSGLFGSEGGMFAGGDIAIMALVIGGVPIAIGVGLIAAGRALWRAPRPPSKATTFSDPPP